MLWLTFTALILRILFFYRFDLQPWIPKILQNACNQWIDDYYLMPVFAGLVCGTDLTPDLKSLFLQLGIFHWFVASGGHLVFLQVLLHKIHIRHTFPLLILLGLFSLTCGLEAPIARAFVGICLSWLSQRQALFFKPHQITLMAGLWTLVLFPVWYSSFSLQLSWLVALALPWSRYHSIQSLLVSLLLIPLSAQWSVLHLLYNFLFTPLFSSVLFPLTILGFALAPLTSLGNQMWELIIFCAQLLPKDFNPLFLPEPLFLWSYILCIHLAHIFYEKRKHV